MRIQACINIKNSEFLRFDLTPYTRNDQAASKDIIKQLQKNDILIRDLGYHVLSVFKEIAGKKAYFLSKYQWPTIFLDQKTEKPINLLKMLKKRKNIDLWMKAGRKDKVPVRLIAVKLPKHEARKKKRALENHPDRRMNPSKEHIQLCKWALLITNVEANILSTENICKTYGLRWRIEIIFKAWKSHCHFNKISPYATKHLVEASVYAKLIYIVIFFAKMLKPVAIIIKTKTGKFISILKLMHFMNNHIENIQMLLRQNVQTQYWITLLSKFCTYEKRKDRRNYPEKLLEIGEQYQLCQR